jgi:hypothetical protein
LSFGIRTKYFALCCVKICLGLKTIIGLHIGSPLIQLLKIRHYDLFKFRNTSEIMNPFRHLVGLHRRGISPTQGPYVHKTAQQRKKRVFIHALSKIRTQGPSFLGVKTNSLDHGYLHFMKQKSAINSVCQEMSLKKFELLLLHSYKSTILLYHELFPSMSLYLTFLSSILLFSFHLRLDLSSGISP